ncbi:reverse transcriptase [Geomonas sp. Red276]
MDKIKTILERGYFPVQLPPAFITTSLANKYSEIMTAWSARNLTYNKIGRCRIEPFSVARSNYNRRVTGIVNPIPFIYLVKNIAVHWSKIQNHYSRGRISLSRPKLARGLRSIEITKFNELYEQKILKSTGYRFALLTDISRFFPSIYTHSIPWAIHGKDAAKQNQKNYTDAFFGNVLDVCSMRIQDFQTIGLPIGPDTSHIIAEIIGVSIDIGLRQKLGRSLAGFRYVDDFCFFFEKREEAEEALTELARIISSFELQINPNKTKVIEIRDLVRESWKFKVKGLTISDDVKSQRDDVHQFFENIFSLEIKLGDESIVKYALKVLSTRIIKKQNWKTFQAYLLKCGYTFPNTLQVIANILITYKHHNYDIDNKAISRFCTGVIKKHSVLDGHSEVAWALWILKELSLDIDDDTFRILEDNTSSVCLLLAISLLKTKNRLKLIRSGFFDKYGTQKSLYGDNWLIAYEAGKAGWIRGGDQSHIESDPFFSSLLSENISFFNIHAKLKPIFDFKDPNGQLDDIFTSDEDINKYFDFDDEDEEYFDTDKSDHDEDEDEENDENDDGSGSDPFSFDPF